MSQARKPSGATGSTIDSSVGGEIREVRKARGLTLADLGERVGCSAAYLSRIERGDTRINVDLLERIGEALHVDPKWFFPTRDGDGELERSYVVRAANRRPMSELYSRPFERVGFLDELISSSFDGQFYMVVTTFPPNDEGEIPTDEPFVTDGEQHGIIIEGELELSLGDEVIQLAIGDGWSFPNTIPHRFRNKRETVARMFWGSTPVMINLVKPMSRTMCGACSRCPCGRSGHRDRSTRQGY